ncbi:MFS transporter [Gorillibacterium massiliense]|uniref:MFS transporter n=1 Tax=Gorillibacterium massiliense TaxID=1280390 RepID=UPI0004AE70DD|nr:MFS transporter [Gorillibacterium massiliense]
MSFVKGWIQGTKSSGMAVYLLLLFLIEFVRGAFIVSYLPIYATERLHFSMSVVGLAISIHYLADNAVKAIAGYLIDRISSRKVLAVGILLSCASLLLVLQAPGAWAILLATALLGIGGSPVWLVCLSNIREESRGTQMSTMYLVWMCGLGLGPVLMNFLMDKGFQIVFYGLIGLLLGCLFLVAAAKKGSVQPPRSLPSFREQVRLFAGEMSKMGFVLPCMMMQTTAGGLLVPLLSPFATKHIGLSHSELSICMMAGGASVLLFLIPAGRGLDRLGGKWFLVGGFGVFAVSLFGLTFSRSFMEAVILSVILGASYASLLPAWNTYLSAFVPKESVGSGWALWQVRFWAVGWLSN